MRHWRESTDRQVLTEAVSRLKGDVEQAYFDCRDDDAGHAHDDLILAEWRLRQSDRRGK